MSERATARRRIDWALVGLGVALLAGAYFRLWDLTAQSLFLDEGYTFMVAGKPWHDMIQQLVYNDFHPPLFYALTHIAIQTLHWQFWDYRYLTAPFGLLTIVAGFAIARRLFGDVAAVIAAIFIAVEPALVEWERLYRMYSVMTAVEAVSWWLLLIAREKEGRARWIWWIAYGATAVVQPYIHYLGAVNVFCQCLYALTNPKRLWPVLASGVTAVIALVPWSWAIRIQYPNGGHVAGTPNLPINWESLSRDVLAAGVRIDWGASDALQWGITAITLAVTAFVVWRYPRTILPFWLAVGAVQILATVATGKALVIPRYLLPVVPAVAIATAACVAYLLRSKLRVAGAVAAVGIPAFLVTCCANIVYDPFYQFPDWYLVNLVVLQHERKSDAMLFVQGFPYVVVGDFTAFRGHPAAGPAMPEDLPYTFRWIDKHHADRIWYIENQFFYPDPRKTIKAYLDRTRKTLMVRSEQRASAGDVVNIILYGPAPAKRYERAARHVAALTTRARGLASNTLGH